MHVGENTNKGYIKQNHLCRLGPLCPLKNRKKLMNDSDDER